VNDSDKFSFCLSQELRARLWDAFELLCLAAFLVGIAAIAAGWTP
jgi:hypothetical protein